jgi:hypothetical protein
MRALRDPLARRRLMLGRNVHGDAPSQVLSMMTAKLGKDRVHSAMALGAEPRNVEWFCVVFVMTV